MSNFPWRPIALDTFLRNMFTLAGRHRRTLLTLYYQRNLSELRHLLDLAYGIRSARERSAPVSGQDLWAPVTRCSPP